MKTMRIFIIKFLFLIVFFFIPQSIQAQTWTWITTDENNYLPQSISGRLIRIGPYGNIYTVAVAEPNIPSSPFFQLLLPNLLLIKQNPLGEIQWIQELKNPPNSNNTIFIQDMEISQDGEVYLVGDWTGNLTQAPIPDTVISLSSNEPGGFIASYDHTGKLTYFDYAPRSRFKGIEISKTQEIYLSGDYKDSLSLGPYSIDGETIYNVFIAKLSQQKDVLELSKIRSPGYISVDDFQISDQDDLYFFSIFLDTVFAFQDTIIPRSSPQHGNIILMKYNLDDGVDWYKHFSRTDVGNSYLTTWKFEVDSTGNVYFPYRYISSSLQIDTTFFSGSKSILDKYSTDTGELLWRRDLGGYQNAFIYSISPVDYGGVILAGDYSRISFGSDTSLIATLPLNSFGENFYIAKYSSDGVFEWVTAPYGRVNPSNIQNVSTNRKGTVAVAGSISSHQNARIANNIDSSITVFYDRNKRGYFQGILQDTSIHDYQQNISGTILADSVADCVDAGGRRGISNIPMIVEPGPYYGMSDRSGNFNIGVEPGSYQVQQLTPQILGLELSPLCPISPNYHQVSLNTGVDTTGLLFVNEAELCPYLALSITSTRRRRCFPGSTMIILCNEGQEDAQNVELFVQLPETLIPTNFSSAYQQINSSTYLLSIPSLASKSCDTLIISDTVSCADIQFLGQDACVSAWTNPGNEAYPCYQPNSQWSGAELEVNGNCHLGDSVIFRITNKGSGDMSQSSLYNIFLDGIQIYSGALILNQGDSTDIAVSTNGLGSNVRFEGLQVPFNPNNTLIFSEVSLCLGSSGSELVNDGAIPISYYSDKTISCDEIVGSYDPNEKTAFPKGKGSIHAIAPGTSINYDLHFQNSGTDTAFKVVLIDTLSPHLNPRSLIVQGASHPYNLQLTGKGRPILICTFDPIELPDSATNELASQGYFSFNISPYDSIPLETVIENFTEIYFDYNPPIKTNTAFHTLSNNFPNNLQPELVRINPNAVNIENPLVRNEIEVYPNPGQGELFIKVDRPLAVDLKVHVVDILGNQVADFIIPKFKNKHFISLPQLSPGLYIIDFEGLGFKKILIEKN